MASAAALPLASAPTSAPAFAAAPVAPARSRGEGQTPASLGDSGGEAWPDFLARATTRTAEIGDVPAKLFETFRTTDDAGLAMAAFARLFHLATSAQDSGAAPEPPWASAAETGGRRAWRYPYEPIRVLLAGNWKAKQLWERLDKRIARPEYEAAPCSAGTLAGRRVLAVGAGPCGLRAAIENRLLGARVTVIERREVFSRLNQLHLWQWCAEECKELGAKLLEPPPQDFGANPDLLHIGIAELQALLFKTGLLLGVEMLFGAKYLDVSWSNDAGWTARLEREQSAGSGAGGFATPIPPESLGGLAVVAGADGLGCTIGKALGIDAIELSSLRAEDAIGLVVNFTPFPEDRELRSYSMARQFYDQRFRDLVAETGADLENIVYTKAKASHYHVMTPTRKCLVEAGVVKDPTSKPVLAAGNVDREALDRLVRKIAAFKFKDNQRTLVECMPGGILTYADRGPMLFDFSKMKRASDGLLFLDPPDGRGTQGSDAGLLVVVVGDALLEPFWPEGLGVARGFLGVLDACSSIATWSSSANREVAKAEFATCFAQLKTLGAATRRNVLRDDEKRYALAPGTRYKAINQPKS